MTRHKSERVICDSSSSSVLSFPASNHLPMGSEMDKLINLEDYRQSRQVDKSVVVVPVPTKGAEILLFTGIQVEYKDAPLLAPSPSPFARQN